MASFAAEVKNEIARLMYDSACDRTAEMAALLRMGGTITFGASHTFGVNFTTENAAVARKMIGLLRQEGAGVHTEIAARRARRLKKNNNYLVRIAPQPGVAELLEHLGLMQEGSLNLGQERKGLAILRKPCCRAAYLRGAFLGGGSVNRPEASYHLELVTPSYAFADLLHSLMRRFDFPAGITDRRDVYVVYLKEGDAVADFLGMMQAEQPAGVYAIANLEKRQFFITGHAEYDPNTLKQVYDRDEKAGLHPQIPVNYYPNDDPTQKPIVRWRSVAHLLFANWLNYYVYQETPYELDAICSDRED